jgi:hypothetical protein
MFATVDQSDKVETNIVPFVDDKQQYKVSTTDCHLWNVAKYINDETAEDTMTWYKSTSEEPATKEKDHQPEDESLDDTSDPLDETADMNHLLQLFETSSN